MKLLEVLLPQEDLRRKEKQVRHKLSKDCEKDLYELLLVLLRFEFQIKMIVE